MRRALLGAAALAALAAGPAEAAALRVRAGEHPGYTRIVVDAPRGLEWRWGVEGERLVVSAPSAEGFELAPARAARGLSRVRAFEAAPGGFVVALACPCGARATTLADGRIVLDLAEGAPRPAAPSTAPADPPASAAPAAAEAAPAPAPTRGPGPVLPAPAPARAAAPTAAAEPADAAGEAAPPPRPQASASQPAPADVEDGAAAAEEPGDAAILAARRKLLEQLTRAAEEGFLTLKAPEAAPEPAPAPAAQASAEPEPEPEPEDEAPDPQAVSEDDLEALAAVAEEAGLRARTALEIADMEARRRAEPVDDRPPHCAPDATLALATWGSEEEPAVALAEGRRGLVGEFDRPSADAVLAYVRLLLHYGFGHEAAMTLDAFDVEIEGRALLRDLAAVVDGEAPPAEGPLASGRDCPGDHGLWAATALALGGALDGAAVDPAALHDALSGLPPPHRLWAARPVAAAALDAGAVDAAEAIASLAARADASASRDPALELILARVEAARGELIRADRMLVDLVDGGTPTGAEAMIRLVEVRAARGVAPPAGLAEDMEAVAYVQRATPLGRRLLAAAATARALGDGFGAALAALRSLGERAEAPEDAAEAARRLVETFEPGDGPEAATEYAETLLGNLDLVGAGPAGDAARTAAAARLSARGLGRLAEDVLAPTLGRGGAPAQRALAAAALAASEPERALGALDGEAGPEAASLRADAFARLFRFEEARAAAAEAGEPEREARYAWLAGEWARAAEQGAPDRRVIAAWMAGKGAPSAELLAAAEAEAAAALRVRALAPPEAVEAVPAEGAPSLEAAAAALEAARRRREIMGALLNDG